MIRPLRAILVIAGLALVARELDLAGAVADLSERGALAPWRRELLVDFRLPRLAMAVLIGSGMATAGWVIQKATRNPMASPAVVSVNGAAALGVMAAVAFGGGDLLGARTLPWVAALSGVASALLLFTLVGRRRAVDGSGLLLAGIALGALWSAATFAIALNTHESAYQYALSWLYGSLSKADWSYVWLLLPAWWFLSLAIHLVADRVELLALEDPVVTGLGGHPEAWRRGALCLGAALAAACVGVGGSFAFLGFLAPALVRTFGGRSFARPGASAALGVGLLLAADVLGQSVVPPAEVPAGIVIALVGGPLFVVGLAVWRRVGIA